MATAGFPKVLIAADGSFQKSINTKVVHKTGRQRIYKERNPLHCTYAPLKHNFISALTPMRCGQWNYFIFLSCDAKLRKNAASLIQKIWTLFQSHPIAHLWLLGPYVSSGSQGRGCNAQQCNSLVNNRVAALACMSYSLMTLPKSKMSLPSRKS